MRFTIAFILKVRIDHPVRALYKKSRRDKLSKLAEENILLPEKSIWKSTTIFEGSVIILRGIVLNATSLGETCCFF